MRSPCTRWQGAKNGDGYAVVKVGGRLHLAHRLAYVGAHGPVPKGLEVHHECGRRDCVNPSHLRAVTHRENCRAKTRRAA